MAERSAQSDMSETKSLEQQNPAAEIPEPTKAAESPAAEPEESFGDIFSAYEKEHARKPEAGNQSREATVVAVNSEAVILDVGFKSEGLLPIGEMRGAVVKVGDKLNVTIKGRDPEGYYQLTRGKVARVTDWDSLKKAFDEKATIVGTVTGVIKGGLSVDVGVRAFMPASRSGTRDANELAKLVEQEIRCRIIKLDVDDEDVVVDRRVIAEDEELAAKQRRFEELKEGDVVQGEVRSLTDYGAFVDIGGADALLHVAEISWHRVNKPSDVLSEGQRIDAKIIRIEPEKKRIAISMKQLQAHPWDSVAEKYKAGDRVRGAITRVADFGAFVEVEPGVEGLIHISEMSWGKKVRHPGDLVKVGETVEAVILGIKFDERRMSLGLKQALGDPWVGATEKFAPGTVIEGPVTNITKFGAFVQLAEGIEGMIHVSEISAEKRINHPQDVLKSGQVVQAQVLAIDPEKRIIRLSMKQLVPTGLDEYLEEHKEGDKVTGRIIDVSGDRCRVELGQGIQAECRIAKEGSNKGQKREDQPRPASAKPDLSSLGSMLQAKWKSGATVNQNKPESLSPGQVREFRIAKLDASAKKIELALE